MLSHVCLCRCRVLTEQTGWWTSGCTSRRGAWMYGWSVAAPTMQNAVSPRTGRPAGGAAPLSPDPDGSLDLRPHGSAPCRMQQYTVECLQYKRHVDNNTTPYVPASRTMAMASKVLTAISPEESVSSPADTAGPWRPLCRPCVVARGEKMEPQAIRFWTYQGWCGRPVTILVYLVADHKLCLHLGTRTPITAQLMQERKGAPWICSVRTQEMAPFLDKFWTRQLSLPAFWDASLDSMSVLQGRHGPGALISLPHDSILARAVSLFAMVALSTTTGF
jgi:hypothetical protein